MPRPTEETMTQPNDIQSIRVRLIAQSGPAAAGGDPLLPGSCSRDDCLSEIPSLLEGYHTLNLSDLSQAKLMRRVDTKYVMPLRHLPEVLAQLQPHYSVLEIDGHRIFTYQSVYFDTSDLRFYRMHHSGARPRFKVRHRRYVETDTSYVEVKVKTNKNRTYKERVKTTGIHPDHREIRRYARGYLPGNIGDISPRLRVGFRRITLADEFSSERLTLDTQIRFRVPGNGQGLVLHPVVVAEHKTLREAKPGSVFSRLMRQRRILPVSFSKYCVGCSLLYPQQTKCNRFKPVFLELQRIHEEVQTSS